MASIIKASINLNEIPDGIYFIHAQSKDGKQQVIKLPVF